MISYAPLWKLLQERGITTYVLREKENLGGGTVQRLQQNMPVSTTTLDTLCSILNCRLQDIAEYIPDQK